MKNISLGVLVIIITTIVTRSQFTISNYYQIKNDVDVDPNVAKNFLILSTNTDVSQFCLSSCNSNTNCLSAVYKLFEKKCSLYSRHFLINELLFSLDTNLFTKEREGRLL